jgi:hypothetical protein
MRKTPSASNMTISGISHHFFSCLQKPTNSLNKDHMLAPGALPYFFLSFPALISARSQTIRAGPKQIANPSGTSHNPQ